MTVTLITQPRIQGRPAGGRLSPVPLALAVYRSRWTLPAFIATALLAVAAYVAAVNVILLAGEGVRRETAHVAALEQETALLTSALAERRSPVWLQVRAAAAGLVDAGSIRHLRLGETVALSALSPADR